MSIIPITWTTEATQTLCVDLYKDAHVGFWREPVSRFSGRLRSSELSEVPRSQLVVRGSSSAQLLSSLRFPLSSAARMFVKPSVTSHFSSECSCFIWTVHPLFEILCWFNGLHWYFYGTFYGFNRICFSAPIFMLNVGVSCVGEHFVSPFLVYFVHIVFCHHVPVLK